MGWKSQMGPIPCNSRRTEGKKMKDWITWPARWRKPGPDRVDHKKPILCDLTVCGRYFWHTFSYFFANRTPTLIKCPTEISWFQGRWASTRRWAMISVWQLQQRCSPSPVIGSSSDQGNIRGGQLEDFWGRFISPSGDSDDSRKISLWIALVMWDSKST